jgi:hypothetical protein
LINLVVQDIKGNKDSDPVTISVEDSGNDDRESEDLYGFLICMSPFIVFILVAVLMISWFKGSKGRKLKRELLMEGIETTGHGNRVKAEVIDEPKNTAKVVDLTPVLSTKSHGKRVQKDDMAVTKKKADPLPTPPKKVDDNEKLHLGKVETVTALVECPFCNNAFKTRVERKKLMNGEPFDVKCTHCGRRGEIG